MFFQFEADFVESLRCIPMGVRLKLDTCGVKLKLQHWHQFNAQERETLVLMSCVTDSEVQAYRDHLQQLVIQYNGQPAKDLAIAEHPPWDNSTTIPVDVTAKVEEFGVTITPESWAKLTPVQRFALIKLSRPSHENKNFLPALKEFGLVRDSSTTTT